MKAILAVMMALCMFTGILVSCDDDSDDPTLDGYWDLVSFYDSDTMTTSPVSPGTSIIHFHGGSHELYYNNKGTLGCTSGTYSVSGDRITYNTGTVDSYSVAETSLRLTTVTGGAPFYNTAGDYSDFNRLGSLDPAPYGTCK